MIRARRGFVLAFFALFATVTQAADCVQRGLAYVGTEKDGIRALRLDGCAGAIASLSTVAQVPRARWLVAHPKLPVIYAAIDDGAREGRVIAYTIDRASGALTAMNQAGAGGSGTTHLWLDAASRTLLASNFGDGSVESIALHGDGSLGTSLSLLQDKGSGPHRRQASAHAHGGIIDPSGRYALVADFGADRVFVYGFDRNTGALASDDAVPPRSFAAAPGSGPRRAVFSPDGRFVYVLNELTGEVLVLRWDAVGGRLAQVQSLAVSSSALRGAHSVSEIVSSPDGRFMYVADRGENTLVVLRRDAQQGTLALEQRVASGGDAPWVLQLDASGRWLLAANYRGGNVALFGIDPATGRLADTGQRVALPGPLSLSFAP